MPARLLFQVRRAYATGRISGRHPLLTSALLPVLPITGAAIVRAVDSPIPRYAHIFVIVAENKGYGQIIGPATRATNIYRLAQQYGVATEFYAEVLYGESAGAGLPGCALAERRSSGRRPAERTLCRQT